MEISILFFLNPSLTKLTDSEGHPDIVKHRLHVCMELIITTRRSSHHFHLYFQWKVEVDRNCPTIFLNHTTYLIEVKLNFF